MTKCLGFLSIAMTVLLCGACESDRIGPAAPPPPQPPSSPANTVAVQIEGRVIDAEREEPVPGAVVRLVRIVPGNAGRSENGPALSATAGENGAFDFSADFPADWREIFLAVDRQGYEPTGTYVRATSPTSIVGAELRVLRTLTIRPGESIDMRVFVGSYVCGDESHLCRRVFIESSGEPIDLEVVPADAQRNVGLFVGPSVNHPYSPTSFQRRVTVSNGEVWMYAAGAERTGVYSGVLAVFEQAMTLTAHRH